MDKVLEDIEELKDKNRELHYQNGSKDRDCIVALILTLNGNIQIEHVYKPSLSDWRDNPSVLFNTNVSDLKQN